MDSLIGDQPFLEIADELPSFGGFWFDEDVEGQVVVGLTDVADLPAAAELIRPYLGEERDEIAFVAQEVQYPFLELARYRTALRGQVFSISGVVALGVNESDNRVKVAIAETAAQPLVAALFETLAIPSESVMFTHMPYPVEASHTLQDQWPGGAVQGGWQIQSSKPSLHARVLGRALERG